jgi:hypothetical protein
LASAAELYPALADCDNVPQRRALLLVRRFMQEDGMARTGFTLLMLLTLAACGGSDSATCDTSPSFSGAPFLSGIKSSSGNLTLSVRSAPTSPPQRGCGAMQYTVTDSSGNPVDGLTLDVVPFMVQMGHGSSLSTSVSAKGQGVYVVTSVDLFMEGQWQLQTSVSGAATDTFTPSFQVD